MAKCKDCLHYDACLAFSKIINIAVDVEKGCEHFKDHTNVVEVVRCKDCKWYWTKSISTFVHCAVSGMQTVKDDFCSYGERRTDG